VTQRKKKESIYNTRKLISIANIYSMSMLVSVFQQHQPSTNTDIPFHTQATNSTVLKKNGAQPPRRGGGLMIRYTAKEQS
jgi:hypothetical protein